MLTSFFIDRPIFSSVISILLLLAGAVSFTVSPIEQYPAMSPPQISVDARYAGATAEVVANTVAAPLESQINGLDNLLYFSSTSSSSGNLSMQVLFKPGSNPDINQVNVQNAVNQAAPQLPQVVTQQGVTVSQKSSSLMLVLSLYTPDDRYDATYLDNYANLYVLEELKRIPGANRASVMGLPNIAMRVWLQPDRMAQLGIAVAEVARAVQGQNQTFGIGQLGAQPMLADVPQSFVVTAQGMLTRPEEFEEIIVRAGRDGAALVRLRDVARVELAKQDYSISSRLNGKTATAIVIYQQPGANAVETAGLVRQRMEELKAGFPSGIDYKVVLDTSEFTRASMEKVLHTFFEAVALVVLVVYVFLQSLRATVIPVLAVPVSIIGTFIGMHLLGFSINMLTMFGLILAIGLVVDDAIVVVENVEVNMSKYGLGAKEAAKRAMAEIAGALMSIVLVLLAVFLPVAFLGGVTGTLYKQFAVTIAISMVLSGITALTLSPALAALIITAHHSEKRGFFRWFETGFDWCRRRYMQGAEIVIRRWYIALTIFGLVLLGTVSMFRSLPSGFVPDEDQGYIFVLMEAEDSASQPVVARLGTQVQEILLRNPAVRDVTLINGYSFLDGLFKNNAAVAFVPLKPFHERTDPSQSAFHVLGELNRAFAGLKGGRVFAVNPPPIPGLGSTGGFEFYLQNRGAGDALSTQNVLESFLASARLRPELQGVSTTFNAFSQQLFVDLDRAKAELLGVPVPDVFQTMQSCFGSQIAGQFNQFSRMWWVMLQADAGYRIDQEAFNQVFVRSRSGAMVPLSTLITTHYVSAPKMLTRFNGFPAAKITGNPAAGSSSGQAIKAMEEVAREVLPENFSFAWAGQALQEKESGSTSAVAFIAGLVVVFLLLAAQFEKWSLPVAVLLAVPFAILGALLLTWALGLKNDVYFQVGMVTLVGLSAKNAILICEFAIERVRHGLSVRQAAVEAAGARLRAIVMTSFAFILGCIPMAVATGAGANSLRAIGTGVIGGMLAATLVAIFFVPFLFWLLEGFGCKNRDVKEGR